VFWDESGASLLPVTRRTWAPRGHTPVIGHRFKWKQASMAAGLCYGSRGGGAAVAFHHQLGVYNSQTLIGEAEIVLLTCGYVEPEVGFEPTTFRLRVEEPSSSVCRPDPFWLLTSVGPPLSVLLTCRVTAGGMTKRMTRPTHGDPPNHGDLPIGIGWS
jgi:hypothetical protein